MNDKYKALEVAINSDPVLNNAQKSALHYIRQLCESKEQESIDFVILNKLSAKEHIPAIMKCIQLHMLGSHILQILKKLH